MTEPKALTHIGEKGQARMVDVTEKPVSHRKATARGYVHLSEGTMALIEEDRIAKGNVIETARLAGVMAAKKTADLIPLCHPLPITHSDVQIELDKEQRRVVIHACARVQASTGVEMEALAAVTVAALTIYDMCKAVDKGMRLEGIEVVSKEKSLAPVK